MGIGQSVLDCCNCLARGTNPPPQTRYQCTARTLKGFSCGLPATKASEAYLCHIHNALRKKEI